MNRTLFYRVLFDDLLLIFSPLLQDFRSFLQHISDLEACKSYRAGDRVFYDFLTISIRDAHE